MIILFVWVFTIIQFQHIYNILNFVRIYYCIVGISLCLSVLLTVYASPKCMVAWLPKSRYVAFVRTLLLSMRRYLYSVLLVFVYSVQHGSNYRILTIFIESSETGQACIIPEAIIYYKIIQSINVR